MRFDWDQILLVISFVCFCLEAAGVKAKVNLIALGLAFLVATFLYGTL